MAGTLASHAADLASVVAAINAAGTATATATGGAAPVLIGHSFGGMIVQK